MAVAVKVGRAVRVAASVGVMVGVGVGVNAWSVATMTIRQEASEEPPSPRRHVSADRPLTMGGAGSPTATA